MQRRFVIPALLAGLAAAPAAMADDRPPRGSIPASEILRRVEQLPDFGWLEEMEWDDDGYWEVEYRTRDGREREVKVDPRSGRIIRHD